jgi:hypothetical protein
VRAASPRLRFERREDLPFLRSAADAPVSCGFAPLSGSLTYLFHRAAQGLTGMLLALIRFSLPGRYQQLAFSPNSFWIASSLPRQSGMPESARGFGRHPALTF